MRFFGILVLVSILVSCQHRNRNNKNPVEPVTPSSDDVRFARGFTIEDNGDYQTITVKDPWQNAQNITFRYILTSDNALPSLPDNSGNIKIPVSRIICLSTTHLGFVDFINENEAVVGISGARYVTNPKIQENISKGKVHDIGYDEQINYELVVNLKPDLVIAYGVSGNEATYLGKLRELGIQVMYVAEYLEDNPLAKMEWVKVFAALFNKTGEVTARFDSVVSAYRSLTIKVNQTANKPKVLLGLPWKGTWYISGGNSYVAKLIEDAGGDYLWKEDDFRDSRPMSLESVYTRALEADYWLNTGTANTIKEVTDVDTRFKNLNVVNDKWIYNYNNLTGPQEGNAYFESGVVEPAVILSDLIHILHPEVLPSHQLKYYKKLK